MEVTNTPRSSGNHKVAFTESTKLLVDAKAEPSSFFGNTEGTTAAASAGKDPIAEPGPSSRCGSSGDPEEVPDALVVEGTGPEEELDAACTSVKATK
jgi:hypothetical protein